MSDNIIFIKNYRDIEINFNKHNSKFEFELIKGELEKYASLTQCLNKIDKYLNEIFNVEPQNAMLKPSSYLDNWKIKIVGVSKSGTISYLDSENKLKELHSFHSKEYTIDNKQNDSLIQEMLTHKKETDAIVKARHKEYQNLVSKFKLIPINDFEFKYL